MIMVSTPCFLGADVDTEGGSQSTRKQSRLVEYKIVHIILPQGLEAYITSFVRLQLVIHPLPSSILTSQSQESIRIPCTDIICR